MVPVSLPLLIALLACVGAEKPTPDSTDSAPSMLCGENYCEGELCWAHLCGGSFSMGDDAQEPDEAPAHTVTLADFDVLLTEVTVAQYARCVEVGACVDRADPDEVPIRCNWGREGRELHPMNCVNHAMAADYCAFVGATLLSEAQWEYAARSGGQPRTYPWGEAPPSCALAALAQEGACGADGTWPVCSFPAGDTEQGLCDMAGNVFEWTLDVYHDDYTGAPTDGSAWVDPPGQFTVMRGGGINSDEDVRTGNRTFHEPDFFYSGMGFRCAR